MCGIAGFFPCANTSDNLDVLKKMSRALSHRGPDDRGIWCDNIVGLSHSRLSIFDLEMTGHQPMISKSGRYIISYNGEIYNFEELKSTLTSHEVCFKGNSDSEVLLEAIDYWGLKDALSKFVGMFAIALWDTQNEQLTLIRDRVGEKPLYYGIINNTLVFGSEIKALKCHPNWSVDIDRSNLSKFLAYNYIVSPDTMYTQVKKLEPGTFIDFTFSNNQWTIKKNSWWLYSSIISSARNDIFTGSLDDAENRVESLLINIISRQSKADVTTGAFLSGGIDSSLIVSIMQSINTERVNTFTIGYESADYNESITAKKISEYLGTNHSEMIVTEQDALSAIPYLPKIYDEPFADASQIPTVLLSSLAGQSVKVALSGDGGDEVFGGYNRYFWGSEIFNKFRYIPYQLRNIISTALKFIPPHSWNSFISTIEKIFCSSFNIRQVGEKIHKIATILMARSDIQLYSMLTMNNHRMAKAVIDGDFVEGLDIVDKTWSDDYSIPKNMMMADFISYLPDDVLVKVDRASMSEGLETRAPYLDHQLIEFVATLPMEYKIKNYSGKLILKNILNKYLPKELFDQPKSGFAVPIDSWLRGSLKEWAGDLLSESTIKKQGYLNYDLVKTTWEDHLSGNRNMQYALWSILMFQMWLDNE